MPAATAGRDAVARCSKCDRAIYQAACMDDWCTCCAHSRAMPPYATMYCLGHRVEVACDWHCSDWESDK
jgi:hypothetical protein